MNGVAVCSLEVEGWTESYLGEWNSLQQEYPDTAPINVGNMGCHGDKATPSVEWGCDRSKIYVLVNIMPLEFSKSLVWGTTSKT